MFDPDRSINLIANSKIEPYETNGENGVGYFGSGSIASLGESLVQYKCADRYLRIANVDKYSGFYRSLNFEYWTVARIKTIELNDIVYLETNYYQFQIQKHRVRIVF